MKGSTDTCPKFHFLFVHMPLFIKSTKKKNKRRNKRNKNDDYFRGEKLCPTSPMVNEQMTKMESSTDTCRLFHFLFVLMPKFIIKEDDKRLIALFRRKTKKYDEIKGNKLK